MHCRFTRDEGQGSGYLLLLGGFGVSVSCEAGALQIDVRSSGGRVDCRVAACVCRLAEELPSGDKSLCHEVFTWCRQPRRFRSWLANAQGDLSSPTLELVRVANPEDSEVSRMAVMQPAR